MTFGNFKRRLPQRGGRQGHPSDNGRTLHTSGPFVPRRVNGDGTPGGEGDGSSGNDPSEDPYLLIKYELDALEPWQIVKVTATYAATDDDPTRFDIWVHEAQGYWACPDCHLRLASVGHTRTRVFRDRTRVPETNIHVRIPIVHCPTNGAREVLVPWTEKPEKWRHVRDLDD